MISIIYRNWFGNKCRCSNINRCSFGHFQVLPQSSSLSADSAKSGGFCGAHFSREESKASATWLWACQNGDILKGSQVRTESTILPLSSFHSLTLHREYLLAAHLNSIANTTKPADP